MPEWLRPTVQSFCQQTLLKSHVGEGIFATESFGSMQRTLRLKVHWGAGAGEAFASVWTQAIADESLMLDILDFCLAHPANHSWNLVAALEVALLEAGSAWTIDRTENGWELQRRIDPIVSDIVHSAAGQNARAAQHLAKAWTEVYGRTPSPGEGYREAVRAVECAGIPVVSPARTGATLGTMIADMTAKPSKWTTSLNPAPPVEAISQVIGMMQLLWKAQLDRHGTPDTSVPLNVSQPEAEAALHLASTLVHWFQSGAVQVAMPHMD